MKNRKILYAASSIKHINNFHLDYISVLRKTGAEIKIMASGEGADFDIPFEKKIFSKKNLISSFKIRKILKHESFDTLILNTALAAFLVRVACGRKRPKTVYIVHGFLFSERKNNLKGFLFRLAEILLRARTDTIIVMNSEDMRLAKKYRLAKRIFLSFGMGCEIREIITPKENIRREFFGKDKFVLCFVGELSKRKNQSFLIRATAMLKAKIPNILLCLVGSGDETKGLSELAKRLGVSGQVIFSGERADACDFIRACDLYVSASIYEGLPFNVIEALGTGSTVLISDIKGHRDIIDDNVDGFLYESGNIEDFVNKTCQIYLKKLSIKEATAREKYLKFSMSNVFSKTLSIIKEALK